MEIQVLPQTLDFYKYEGDLTEIVESIQAMPVGPNNHNLKSETSYLLDQEEYAPLRAWVGSCLAETMKSRGYEYSVRITQSWFNRTEKGQWHHRHCHANSLFSGVLYLTPSDSETWFSTVSIWPAPDENLPFYGGSSSPHEVISRIQTQPGVLVVFPSNLDHSVNEHTLEEPRYSISFNTFPTGSFGLESVYTALTL